MNNSFVATDANRDETLCVYNTTNYDQFSTIVGNREVNRANVRKIVASMRKEHLKVPAIINGRGEVCDGQHRLEACRELEIPFYYIVIPNYELKEVQEINANQRNWRDIDFLNSFVKRDTVDRGSFTPYVNMHEMVEHYDISISSLLTIIYEGNTNKSVGEHFRAGMTTMSQEEIIEITDVIDDLKNINEFLPDRAFTKSFISVLMGLRTFEEYNITQFLQGLNSNRGLTKELNETGLVKNIVTIAVNIFNNDGKVKRNKAIMSEAAAWSVKDANSIQWV